MGYRLVQYLTFEDGNQCIVNRQFVYGYSYVLIF